MCSTKFAIIVFCCIFFTVLTGYSQVHISGKVLNSKAMPVELATVFLQSGGAEPRVTLADSLGGYTFSVTKGTYNFRVSMVNYKTKEVVLTVEHDTIINITLEENIKELSGVVVTSSKPVVERKIDRIVFNVENRVFSGGGDALDALKESPGVRVNNDNVSIIGKSTLQVMINGRLIRLSGNDLSNYLRSVKYEDIAKIEVITNPPANYDAEGNSGLINIVLKKNNKENFSGSVNGSYSQASYPTGIIGGDLNYQKKKVSVFSGFRYRNGSTGPFLSSNVYYPSQTWSSESNRRNYYKYISGRAGVDYQINKRSAAQVQYIVTTSDWDIKDFEKTSILNTRRNVFDSVLKTSSYSTSTNYSHSINGDYKIELDSLGRKIVLNADYFYYSNDADRPSATASYVGDNLNYRSLFRQDNLASQAIRIYSSKVDVTLPYKFGTIETGGKISFINNESNASLYKYQGDTAVIDPANSNIFLYTENTQAVYGSFTKKPGKKWSLKTGLRLEATQTRGNSETLKQVNKNNYIRLFPTLYITYAPNDRQTFSFNYGRRIRRPNYGNLNPFRWYTNPYSFTEGNPSLQPSYTDILELSHTYKDNLISSVYLNRIRNGYGQVTFLKADTNIQITRSVNYYDSYQTGWSESYTVKPLPFWQSYNQFYLYYSHATAAIEGVPARQDGWGAYFSTNNTFSLNAKKTATAEIDYWYQFPESTDLTVTNGYSQLDVGLKLQLLKKKLQTSFIVTDVFSGCRPVFTTSNNEIKQVFRNYFDQRSLRITVNYPFGNSKIKSKQHAAGNEDEKKRAN